MAMLHCLRSSFGPRKTKFESSTYTIKKFISDNENINLKMPSFLWQGKFAQSGKQDKTFTCPSGMDPAWSGRGGGGGSASSGAELCRSCIGTPGNQLASLLQSLAWLLYLNCNCCSQFAYHHVITQITVSHFVSNTYVKISQLVNKMCSQQACSKLVNKL
jgi:hypothetical protein